MNNSANAKRVPAVHRALAVLEFLAHSRRGVSVSDISRMLGIPKSSTHRMLKALEAENCVQLDPRTERYRFGFRLVSLGRSAIENMHIREVARPLLISLMRNTGLTVHLTVLDCGQAIVVEKIEAPGLLKVGTWPGRAMDVHSTAAGKALVAFLPDDQLESMAKSRVLVRHNKNTIASVHKLKLDLAGVRELGYAVDDEEDEVGIRCIGAPIPDDEESVVAAVSVVGTVLEVPRTGIRQLGATVKKYAAGISACLHSS